MSNMSYCRFTNTRSDLQVCLDAIRQETRLSDFEARAGKWMFEEFLDFCQEQGIIEDYDQEILTELFRYLQKKGKDDDA